MCKEHPICTVHIGTEVYKYGKILHIGVNKYTSGRYFSHPSMQCAASNGLAEAHIGANVCPQSVHIGVPMWYWSFCSEWLAFKAYGIETPGPNNNPTFGRSSSLMYYKKALSYFMPHCLMPWNFQQRCGNPTRLTDVNDLIKAVVRKETQKQGRPSQARRPFEKEEFVQVVTICSKFHDPNIRYSILALFKFVFHLIGCLNDCCDFKKKNLGKQLVSIYFYCEATAIK